MCEVPGWGHQMAADRVLAEMRALGLTATEFGPAGFLPADPDARAALLAAHGLRAVGGFVPVVLHDPARDPLPEVRRALAAFGDADMLVLAAATGRDGYDARPALDDEGWATLLGNLDRLAAHAAGRGVWATLHPHVGTLIERGEEVDRVLAGSQIPLCLDTGHLFIGGTDPLDLARRAPGRIAHTHLKDVDADLAGRVRRGELTYTEAVRAGLYRPLGAGAIDIAAIVEILAEAGYDGWYVLEQDTVVEAEPPPRTRPCDAVRAGIDYLERVFP
ncbi:MAG TPA: sugar phosphate isomerase/epimerase [Streptosporangiaceae bacterium]|nr:sugar phosphate isomerase/epimerase [Streptosporangiaceae bacterium]